LQLRHGQAVHVDYVDLADAEAQVEFSEVLAVIEDRSLPYPLVAVNGQLRLAGTAQYYQVLPLVEELLPAENEQIET
jgi:disulfide oxidoreductase YuzD